MKRVFLFVFCSLACVCMSASDQRYVGGDISMLPLYEVHNQPYRDAYGKKIDNMLSWLMQDCGWNLFRVRLFVNPAKTDPSVSQDLEYVTQLGQRIKAAGGAFMLDFHYSDTWVDALHIQAPAAWKGKSDAEMEQALSQYTHQVLSALKSANATPDFVQVGNEIMYGLCDIAVHPYDKAGDNWTGYLALVKAGCEAVREECPKAQIIIHTDRPCNTSYNKYYYQKLVDANIDFDIIGLSYYPFWHGYLTDEQVKSKSDKNNLVKSVKQLALDFPAKKVQIVECAYNFNYWPSTGVSYDTRDVWPCSKEGQYNFVKALVDALQPLENVTGICYWFPEEAGNGDDTDWNTSKGTVLWTWMNRGFWNPENSSGHAINRLAPASESVLPHTVCAPYYMAGFVKELPSGMESIQHSEVRIQKVIRDGQLYLIYKGRMYDVRGNRIGN
ncbi:MAG: glycosyl hydrolase 53 family protein [Paludibacteraceae bacterium]|nr:glycosyl hydrolase 53 family protein [Paludibacteraceae bacterium]